MVDGLPIQVEDVLVHIGYLTVRFQFVKYLERGFNKSQD
jgi:hypothetical protein